MLDNTKLEELFCPPQNPTDKVLLLLVEIGARFRLDIFSPVDSEGMLELVSKGLDVSTFVTPKACINTSVKLVFVVNFIESLVSAEDAIA